ncbi:MAG TPA: OmpH family outer membrane protein [Pyrinomonadaceae bacterium]|nr:OmpH family outer membrane protein [Pyrinomonadaceae bacterium]
MRILYTTRNSLLAGPAIPLWVILPMATVCLAAGIVWSSTGEATAQAIPSRIGVIDFQKILTESASGKASVARLTGLQRDRLTKAKQMNDELKRVETSLNNPALSPAQRNTIGQQMTEKQVAIKRFAEDAEKEIGSARVRELQTLQERLRPVIESMGKEMGMAALFDKQESGIIYSNVAIDITNTVIVRFNAAPAPAPRP